MTKPDPINDRQDKQDKHNDRDNDNRGDCDLCGEWSSRLVDGVCSSCRTLYRIK